MPAKSHFSAALDAGFFPQNDGSYAGVGFGTRRMDVLAVEPEDDGHLRMFIYAAGTNNLMVQFLLPVVLHLHHHGCNAPAGSRL